MTMKIKTNLNRNRMFTRRKAQLYVVELVVAVLLITTAILVLQTIQTTQNSTKIQTRTELREIGWNVLAASDEVGILRPAVYSKHIQENSSEIRALADFLGMALAPELEYILDIKNQISGDTRNLIGGEKRVERGTEREIIVVSYLVLGISHSTSNQDIFDPVAVILSLWYAT